MDVWKSVKFAVLLMLLVVWVMIYVLITGMWYGYLEWRYGPQEYEQISPEERVYNHQWTFPVRKKNKR